MARGGHDSIKFHLGLSCHDPSTPCGRVTPETALWPVAIFYPFGHPTPIWKKERLPENEKVDLDNKNKLPY
jgi:hypothetical protein